MTTPLVHPTDLPTPERMFRALGEAHHDLSCWIQLAKRQTKEIPNYGHVPWAPTDDGIAFSEFVLAGIEGAIGAYVRERDAKEAAKKVEVPSRPECTFEYCPNKGGCVGPCQYPLATT